MIFVKVPPMTVNCFDREKKALAYLRYRILRVSDKYGTYWAGGEPCSDSPATWGAG